MNDLVRGTCVECLGRGDGKETALGSEGRDKGSLNEFGLEAINHLWLNFYYNQKSRYLILKAFKD